MRDRAAGTRSRKISHTKDPMFWRTLHEKLLRLLASDHAVAAVEFAILAPSMIFLLLVILDFSNAYNIILKIISATNAAAQYAFVNAQNVTAGTVSSFLTQVASVATSTAGTSSAPTVTVLFNNVSNNTNFDNYYCLSGYNPTSWSSTGTSSGSCGSSVMSGKFVTITTSSASAPLFPSDPIMGTLITLTDLAVVRVE